MAIRGEVVAAFLLMGAWAWSGAQAGAEDEYRRGLAAYRSEDLPTAVAALEGAAAQDYPPALVLLAYIMDKAEEDHRAAALYRRAAEAGDPAGQVGLAGLYAAGEGVARDVEEALVWYRRAADQGYAPAMVILAENHLTGGLGLAPDRTEALQWLERAAAGGYDPARLRLGQLKRTETVDSEAKR